MPPPDWTPPARFDEYRLVRPLGRGAMGEVYLAHDLLLDRPVAVKFIAGVEPGPAARERFFREARAIARLSHPNVVAIHRVGETDRRPYLVSEFIRGQPLDQLPKPVPEGRVLEIAIGLARGLAAAHRAGVLHRDIKPANAMLTEDGEVKLLDFGLAKLVDETALPASLPASVPAWVPSSNLGATVSMVGVEVAPPPAEAESSAPSPGSAATATQAGAVMGTPLYMAPEAWRGEPASRRTDVYSLGALLFELCAGAAPHRGVPLGELSRAVQDRDAPPLQSLRPTLDVGLAATIDRCLSRVPAARFDSGDALREALEELQARVDSTPLGRASDGENPYRGLQPFDGEHRAFFFGRGADIRAVVERLRAESLVLIAGDSGVGKSSLARAGVLPAIEEGALGRLAVVRVVPGRRPLEALARALAPLCSTDEETLLVQLRDEPERVGRRLRREHGGNILVLVDQLEELLTLASPEVARQTGEALAAIALRAGGVRLLGTIRSDFLGRLASMPGLGDEVQRALYLLKPLPETGLRAAITEPARMSGCRFESSEMVDELVRVANRSGGLPLVQFALAELWERRDRARGVVPESALSAIGGVEGALARHADGVIEALLPLERKRARRILLALVTEEETRARRTETELLGPGDPASTRALEALVRERLVVARGAEEAGEGTYEIAHEALVHGWEMLREWLLSDVELRAVRERLTRAASDWERLGRAKETLWQKRQLREALRMSSADLGARETAFLAASRRALLVQRLRRVLAVAAVPLAVGFVYALFAVRERRELRREIAGRVAVAETALAGARHESAEVDRMRADCFERFDKGERAEGDRLWDAVRKRDLEIDVEYARASQELEAALMLDPRGVEVEGKVADLILWRAEAAERDFRTRERDELLGRLPVYDRDGSRGRAYAAAGTLTVKTEPPGAELTLERYGGGPRLRAISTVRLGTSPLGETPVEPGSYLLLIVSGGRLTRYPFLVARGERRELRVPLPATLPDGYLYVPPGRFLYGSTADESMRKSFLNADPLHTVYTGAYLIAREETTFADWIDYLSTLGAEEWHRRAPHVVAAGHAGALELSADGDGDYRLMLQVTAQATYRAGPGERLRFPARRRRQLVDWHRLPVVGVDLDDARTYAAWLDRSGRVPGARLCDEHEWERAARGADSREYPHGDLLQPDDADFDLTYDKQPFGMGPDEVGSHPASRSPFGVDDLTGNAWEWVVTREGGGALIRGGSYYHGQSSALSTNREPSEPTLRSVHVGVRICAAVSSRSGEPREEGGTPNRNRRSVLRAAPRAGHR